MGVAHFKNFKENYKGAQTCVKTIHYRNARGISNLDLQLNRAL